MRSSVAAAAIPRARVATAAIVRSRVAATAIVRSRLAAAIVAIAVLAGLAPTADAQAEPWTRTDFRFPSWDGVELDATVWVPDGKGPFPAVLVTNGWNHRHDQAVELEFSERLARNGYLVLGWTSRGWGNSDGEVELDGPKEQQDVIAILDYLATGSYPVQMDGDGDPRVGMLGESYAGAIQMLVAAQDSRIDAIVPRITWNNLLDALAPADVFKVGWVSELYATGQTVSRGAPVPSQYPGEPDPDGPSPTLTQWYADAWANNGPTPEMRSEIGVVRSLRPGTLQVPTLLIQGWGDTLFEPNHAIRTFQDLQARGVPVRLVLYPGGHGQDLDDNHTVARLVEATVVDWFNTTLRGDMPALPPFPVVRYRPAQDDAVGEMQWPPGGTSTWTGYLGPAGAEGLSSTIPQAASETELVNPVLPGSCGDVPSFQDEASFCPYSLPAATAVWSGPLLAADTEVTGQPRVRLHVSSTQQSDVRLFLTLVDVAPDGTASPVWRQTTPMRLSTGAAGSTDIVMQAVTHTFAAGHRIGLHVATADAAFFASREAGTVTVSSSPAQPSWITVPMVPKDAWGDREPPAISAVRTDPRGVILRVTDNLAVATVTSDLGQPSILDMETLRPGGVPADAREWNVVFQDAPANGTLRVTATDMAGNVVHADVMVGPAAADPCRLCGDEVQEPGGQGTPGPGWATILALLAWAAAAARRR